MGEEITYSRFVKSDYQQYRRDISVDALAKRYCRTMTSIYRVVNEMRAHRILELPLEYMSHPSFAEFDAEREILGPMPPVFDHDPDQSLTSLQKLVDLDAHVVLPGHGAPFDGTPAEAVRLARQGGGNGSRRRAARSRRG